MARKSSSNIDFRQAFEGLSGQFRGLDTRDPSSWPALPRYALLVLVAAVMVVILWFAWLKGVNEELEGDQARELTLRNDYRGKLQKAVSLEELKKQRVQVLQYVNLLEKQLPNKAEMDALLSDINQAGLGRSLQFELFRPGHLVAKDYYAELPIALKVTGRYHDIGAFSSDIAHLSRIVTLNNLSVVPSGDKDKSGMLVLEATAQTFRYLDPEEIAAQQKAAAKPGAKKCWRALDGGSWPVAWPPCWAAASRRRRTCGSGWPSKGTRWCPRSRPWPSPRNTCRRTTPRPRRLILSATNA